MGRLLYFEKLFFRIDVNASLYVQRDELNLFLSFALPDVTASQRDAIFATHDFVANSKLNRFEFLTLCRDSLWEVPLAHLESAVDIMMAARGARIRANAATWTALSQSIDRWSRLLMPAGASCMSNLPYLTLPYLTLH